MPVVSEAAIGVLNSLLRGERAAVETYRQAETKFQDLLEAELLKQIARDHLHVASDLRDQVMRMGGEACNDSGVWGYFAQFVEGGAMLLGRTTALRALKEGEHMGVYGYETALRNDELPSECRILISNSFLPKCAKHIYHLNQMIALQ